MPIPRMTTRRWMIAVAIVALSFGALMHRRSTLLNRAAKHLNEAGLIAVETPSGETRVYPASAADPVHLERNIELWDKYRRAVRRPWLPVAP